MTAEAFSDDVFTDLRKEFRKMVSADARATRGAAYVRANRTLIRDYADTLFNTATIEADRCLQKFGERSGKSVRMNRSAVDSYLDGFGTEYMGLAIRDGTEAILAAYGMKARGKSYLIPERGVPQHVAI